MKMVSRQNPFQKNPAQVSVNRILLLLLFILLLLPLGQGGAEEKMTIGAVEDVILMPWRVRLPARIDTGAATSSLDARELHVKNNMAEFWLPKKYGGLQLSLPVIEWQKIRSADFSEQRPVVEIILCLGEKLIRTKVTLNDRSKASYPLIIGRNVLKNKFVVDCMHSNRLPPRCPEGPSQ